MGLLMPNTSQREERLQRDFALAPWGSLASINERPVMAFTTREIETPDSVTRVVAADAKLRDENPGDDIGEKMVLNMGPSHPATHGVLRLVLELDGEIITKATPDVGYLHRGDEKIAENMQYNQFVPYTDRLDYLAPLANNVAYALAVEKLMGWELPPRGKAIRMICCETCAHLRAPARAWRDGARSRRDDGFSLHLHRTRKTLQSCSNC